MKERRVNHLEINEIGYMSIDEHSKEDDKPREPRNPNPRGATAVLDHCRSPQWMFRLGLRRSQTSYTTESDPN
jgi:hypothetical protein